MNDLRKAAEMALEALEEYTCVVQSGTYPNKWHEVVDGGAPARKAIQALRQALAQPEHEPVAWMHNFIEGTVITHEPADIGRHPDRWTALYEDPPPCKTCQSLAMAVMNDQTYHEKAIPKREWVGLTDEEIKDIIFADDTEFGLKTYSASDWAKIKRTENLLREKNVPQP